MLKHIKVLIRFVRMTSDHLVTTTVVTKLMAKRDMNVQR
ncbi:Uncharacterised protein [Vibrio cholerae]|nr:Uncharacterised protein [Vibrio cholerae]